eukprot:TRINITY_DN9475_c0_g2_i3.p1 TRINITY_DN9475_c0_g2~~TRINITY_DN9475_c0_g2_i3.p1  ORF type:complete len:766 (-),score=169.44 TRINITY_DN9475_c0_g2_i3:15-2312(-)
MFGDKSKSSEYKIRAVGIKFGYLVKQGLKLKTWKRRWFVMTHEQLYYFESPSDLQPLGSLSMKEITSVVAASDSDTSRSHCLKVATGNRTYFFSPEEKKDFDEWLIALRSFSNLFPSRLTSVIEQLPQIEKLLGLFEVVAKLIPVCNNVALQCGKDLSLQRDIVECVKKLGSTCINLSNATFATVSKVSSSKNWQTGSSFATLMQSLEQLRVCSESVMKLITQARVVNSSEVVRLLYDCSNSVASAAKMFELTKVEDAAPRTPSTSLGETAKPVYSPPQHQSMVVNRDRNLPISINEIFNLLAEMTDSVSILVKEIRAGTQPQDILSSCKIVTYLTNKITGHADTIMTGAIPDFLKYMLHESIQRFQESVLVVILFVKSAVKNTAPSPAMCQVLDDAVINCGNCMHDLLVNARIVMDYMEAYRLGIELELLANLDSGQYSSSLADYCSLVGKASTLSKFLEEVSAILHRTWYSTTDGNTDSSLIRYAAAFLETVQELVQGTISVATSISFDDLAFHEDVKALMEVANMIILSLRTSSSESLARMGIYQTFSLWKELTANLTNIVSRVRDALKEAGKIEDEDMERDVNIWEDVKDSSENILFSKEEGEVEKIKAATLNKLVQRLTSDAIADLKFRNVFIATYRSFSTPEKLFQKLVQRFLVPKTRLPPNVDVDEYIKKFVSPIQMRVINVMKLWMEQCYMDIDDKLLGQIDAFINKTFTADGLTPVSKHMLPTYRKIVPLRKKDLVTLKSTIDAGLSAQVRVNLVW